MEEDFSGKVVLVTGASAGIGEAIALLFAKLGAQLSLVGRNEENLRDVAARCEELKGVKPLTIVADLATDAGCEKTAKDTVDHFGRLDILINNAAVGARSLIQNADMEQFDRVFTTNVRGVYYLTRLLVPELIRAKGNIVNISSVSATLVSVGSLPYSMTKAALDHFSDLIALELAPHGVRVNTVSPGITVSKFVQRMTGYTDEKYASWLSEAARAAPLGVVSTGADVAAAVAHLAGARSSTVTGARLHVDAGIRFAGSSNLMTKQVEDTQKYNQSQ